MKFFVQMPMAPGIQAAGIDYRSGFSAFAHRVGDPQRDHVLVLTLDALEVDPLKELWSAWNNVEIQVANPLPTSNSAVATPCFTAMGEDICVTALDAFYARRWVPASPVTEHHIATFDLQERLRDETEHGNSVFLSVDLRVKDMRGSISWAEYVDWWGAVVAEVPREIVDYARSRLRKSPLTAAGRPFGAAGSSIAFQRPTTPMIRMKALANETRVRAGVVVAQSHRWWESRETRREARRRQRMTKPVLDPDAGMPIPQFSRADVESVIECVRARDDVTWQVLANTCVDSDSIAKECHSRLGVWPISFSYPKPRQLTSPVEQLSPIIPGFPYSFFDNETYLDTYAKASMALTFRKAGWDCFRHVEILASGSVPFMPDAAEIPPFSMIHYPKAALAEVAARALESGGRPDETTRLSFRDYFESHLTTSSMADYLLRVSGLDDVERILFLDDQTPVNPEYQSTLTLIGLKQLLGQRCEVAFPADFIYSDSAASASAYYGRGFGYSHAVNSSARTTSERDSVVGHGIDDLLSYDAVVVGSISRNRSLARMVLMQCDPERVILIHGEDGPPDEGEASELRQLRANVFVRAIHSRM